MTSSILSAKENTVGGLPRTPWIGAPKDQRAEIWRKACTSAIGYIVEALWPTENMDMSSYSAVRDAASDVIAALLKNDPSVDPADRSHLIGWLGRAEAVIQGGIKRPWQAHRAIGSLNEDLIHRWTVAAWRDGDDLEPPCWAENLIEDLRRRTGPCENPLGWGAVPAHWPADQAYDPANMQRDLLLFLCEFGDQVRRAPSMSGDRPVDHKAMSETVGICCVALRILDSTTERVDQRVLPHLAVFEQRYTHSLVDEDILRLALAADERKILAGCGHGLRAGDGDRAVVRGRKL